MAYLKLVTKMAPNNSNKTHIKNDHIVTVLVCAIAIPLSMSLWIINLIYTKFFVKNEGFDGKFLDLIFLKNIKNYR